MIPGRVTEHATAKDGFAVTTDFVVVHERAVLLSARGLTPLIPMDTLDADREAMANINVRGLSDKTKQALRVRAAKEGMSLEAYARRALVAASTTGAREPARILDLARKYFGAKDGVDLDVPPRRTRRSPVAFS